MTSATDHVLTNTFPNVLEVFLEYLRQRFLDSHKEINPPFYQYLDINKGRHDLPYLKSGYRLITFNGKKQLKTIELQTKDYQGYVDLPLKQQGELTLTLQPGNIGQSVTEKIDTGKSKKKQQSIRLYSNIPGSYLLKKKGKKTGDLIYVPHHIQINSDKVNLKKHFSQIKGFRENDLNTLIRRIKHIAHWQLQFVNVRLYWDKDKLPATFDANSKEKLKDPKLLKPGKIIASGEDLFATLYQEPPPKSYQIGGLASRYLSCVSLTSPSVCDQWIKDQQKEDLKDPFGGNIYLMNQIDCYYGGCIPVGAREGSGKDNRGKANSTLKIIYDFLKTKKDNKLKKLYIELCARAAATSLTHHILKNILNINHKQEEFLDLISTPMKDPERVLLGFSLNKPTNLQAKDAYNDYVKDSGKSGGLHALCHTISWSTIQGIELCAALPNDYDADEVSYENREKFKTSKKENNSFLKHLQAILFELGFWGSKQVPPEGTSYGDYDIRTFAALRELQMYVTCPKTAQYSPKKPTKHYGKNLQQVDNDYKRPKLLLTSQLDSPTYQLIRYWRMRRFRCPVVIEVWKREKKTTKKTEKNWKSWKTSHSISIESHMNIWMVDDFMKNTGGEAAFCRDFTGYYNYTAPELIPKENLQPVGGYVAYNSGGGLKTVRKHLTTEFCLFPFSGTTFGLHSDLTNATTDPRNTLGKHLTQLYRVIMSVGSVEAFGYADGLIGHDNTIISYPLFHYVIALSYHRKVKQLDSEKKIKYSLYKGEFGGFLKFLNHYYPKLYQQYFGLLGLDVSSFKAKKGKISYTGTIALSRLDKTLGEGTDSQMIKKKVITSKGKNRHFCYYWLHSSRVYYHTLMSLRDNVEMRKAIFTFALLRVYGILTSTPRKTKIKTKGEDSLRSEASITTMLRWSVKEPGSCQGKGLKTAHSNKNKNEKQKVSEILNAMPSGMTGTAKSALKYLNNNSHWDNNYLELATSTKISGLNTRLSVEKNSFPKADDVKRVINHLLGKDKKGKDKFNPK